MYRLHQSFFDDTVVLNNVFGSSPCPTPERSDTEPITRSMSTTTDPVSKTNGLRHYMSMLQVNSLSTYALISFRSQLSPTHISVFLEAPLPVYVTPQLQTKHVRPDFVASTHWPRLEQDFVAFLQASCVMKQVEIEPIGCWGRGWLGRGDCSCRGMTSRIRRLSTSKARTASRNLSLLFIILLRNDWMR